MEQVLEREIDRLCQLSAEGPRQFIGESRCWEVATAGCRFQVEAQVVEDERTHVCVLLLIDDGPVALHPAPVTAWYFVDADGWVDR